MHEQRLAIEESTRNGQKTNSAGGVKRLLAQTICMEYQTLFSWQNKKDIISLLSAELKQW